jgi:hypothetical protein
LGGGHGQLELEVVAEEDRPAAAVTGTLVVVVDVVVSAAEAVVVVVSSAEADSITSAERAWTPRTATRAQVAAVAAVAANRRDLAAGWRRRRRPGWGEGEEFMTSTVGSVFQRSPCPR